MSCACRARVPLGVRLVCVPFPPLYSFFSRSNFRQARPLIKLLEEAKQVVPEELARMASMGESQYMLR